jgi:hypothetical protein
MKDIELQLSIGESLVCAALGLNSPESRDPWTVKESDFIEPENAPTQLDFLIDELLNKYVGHRNPNVKHLITYSFFKSFLYTTMSILHRLPQSGYWL